MNREEATQWLEQIKNFLIYGGDEKFDAKRKEALDMAIQALEQEPCEQIRWERDLAVKQLNDLGYSLGEKIRTCEDAISREQAIKAMQGLCTNDATNPYCENPHIDVIYDTLMDLPSVQPIRSVKGLIENINNLSDTIRGIRSDGNCFFTPEEFIKIIKEYCGLEDSNGISD